MNRLQNYIKLISLNGGDTELEKYCKYLNEALSKPNSLAYINDNDPFIVVGENLGFDFKEAVSTKGDKDDVIKNFIREELKKCVGPPPPPPPPKPPAPREDVPPTTREKTTLEFPYYDSGDQQYHTFKVTVYATKQNRDTYVGGGSVGRTETVKSVLDSFKQKCNTCIVSSGKQYVKSLEGKDLYTTFAHLNLKYDNAEIYIIS